MENLLFFMISFVLVFIILLINYFIKRKKGTVKYMKEIKYLVNTFKLNRKQLDYNSVALISIMLNSLIISLVASISSSLDYNYFWRLAIGFVLLMMSIYVFYGILGKFLKRRELKK